MVVDPFEIGSLDETVRIYGEAFNHLAIGFLVWRFQTDTAPVSFSLINANSAASRIAGIELSGYYGRSFADTLPGLLKTNIPKACLNVLLTSRRQNLGEIHYGDDRISLGVFAVKAFPLPDKCVGVVFERITEKKQTEEALRRSEMRYRALAETASEAILTIDASSTILFVNSATERIFGYSIAEMIGQEVTMLMPDYLRHVHKAAVARFMETGYRHLNWASVQLPGLHKDGREIPVELSIAEHMEGADKRFTGILRDITERTQREEALRKQIAINKLLQTVAAAANEATTIEEAMQVAISEVCLHTGWPLGHVYVRTDDPEATLVPSPIWHVSGPDKFEPFRFLTERTILHKGEGLPGQVLESGTPVWMRDITKVANFPRRQHPDHIVLRAAFAFPIKAGNEVVAVLELFSTEEGEPDEDLLRTAAHVGAQLGHVVERKRAENALRSLSAYLLRCQDEERRRIGRELHDSAGQYLSALGMNLDQVKRSAVIHDPLGQKALMESFELLDRCISEIRTLSYLLHPPVLEEMGLSSAVPWYVEGFAKRSGIAVSVDIGDNLIRLPHDVEMVLFRIVQEGLTNILRHSESKNATIRMFAERAELFLEVTDDGKGIPAAVLATGKIGVGIAGMRERLGAIGGRLIITSTDKGTTVKAVVPLKIR